jgi:DTW domain-containing protein
VSRRDNVELRCTACRMHRSLCICALLPRMETRTRVVLVIHRDEERKPTNTGLLATRCLTNSEVCLRGRVGVPAPVFKWDGSVQPLFLFPHEGARPLEAFAGTERPLQLIVPDGTWRQAAKVRSRTAGLEDVACASLPQAASSLRRLRSETRPHGMATMEAIARALGVLEGAQVEDALLGIMRIMIERTLWLRGELRSEELTGGVPEAARLVDPRGGTTNLSVRSSSHCADRRAD